MRCINRAPQELGTWVRYAHIIVVFVDSLKFRMKRSLHARFFGVGGGGGSR